MKILNLNRYWKNVFLQFSGNSVAQVIGILGMPILTRIYSPEDFATQAVFMQIVMLLTGFVTLRFEYFIPLLKNKEEYYFLAKYIVVLGFKLSIIYTFLIIILDVLQVLDIFGRASWYFLYLAPLTAYLISLALVFQHEAQRNEKYSESAKSEVVSKSSYVLVAASSYIFLNGLGIVFSNFYSALAKISYFKRYLKEILFNFKKIHGNKCLIDIYRARSNGMILSNVLLIIAGIIPIIFIDKEFGSTALGNFSLAMATIFLPSTLIGSAIGNVFYQKSAILFNEKKYDEINKLWGETLFSLLKIASIVYIVAFLLSPYIYIYIFGSKWVYAGDLAQYFVFAAFFSFLAGPLDRLSLIFSIEYYIPLIHMLRLFLISIVTLSAFVFDLDLKEYVLSVSLCLAFNYALDIILCRYLIFSKVSEK